MSTPILPEPGDPVLTVRQPWADLEAAGVKDVENRSWKPYSTLPQWTLCAWCSVRRDLPPQRGNKHTHETPRGPLEFRADEFPEDRTPFPFRLWIHAAAKLDEDVQRELWHNAPSRTVRAVLAGPLPLGALVASVEVWGCHHADECHAEWPVGMGPLVRDRYCSRWAQPNRFHWPLRDPVPLDVPVPMRGRQGLWRITEADLAGAS